MAQGNPSTKFSARFDRNVASRLESHSQRAGITKSRLAERYVDEGTRMDEHPGIIFRDGPAGRRAALAGGPDIWEVIASLKAGSARGSSAVAKLSETLNLPASQIQLALEYYGDYPEDIDERVRRNLDEADAAEAAWRRSQAVLQ